MQNLKDNSIDIILPVYNEEDNIEKITNSIIELFQKKKITRYNIIIAEDGSTDNTKKILFSIKKNEKIKVISFSERLGYTKSILNAIQLSKSKFLIFLDSDGQHEVNDIINFIRLANNNLIIGYRKKRSDSIGRVILHNLARKFISFFVKLRMRDASCGFIFVDRELMNKISKHIGYTESCFWWEFSIIVSKMRLNFIEREITHHKRILGTGFFKLKDLFRLFFKEFSGLVKLIFYLRKK